MKQRWMKRAMAFLGAGTMMGLDGCLPDDFFSNLLGSSIAEVWSEILSDLLNTFFPLP